MPTIPEFALNWQATPGCDCRLCRLVSLDASTHALLFALAAAMLTDCTPDWLIPSLHGESEETAFIDHLVEAGLAQCDELGHYTLTSEDASAVVAEVLIAGLLFLGGGDASIDVLWPPIPLADL